MDLNTLCFLLFCLLFTGFLLLDGLDFGVGMLLWAGKNDIERQALIQTIAPVWEGNQVWLIVAAGVLFAGFPHVYATLFSGLYLALFIVLAALLLRGLAIELHNKEDHPAWRSFCYWSVFLGSLVPALLWGIALGSMLSGLPIAGDKQYSGGFLALISMHSLLSGLTYVLLFLSQGAIYLAVKLESSLARRMQQASLATVKYTLPAVVCQAIFTVTATTAGHKGLVFILAVTTLICLFFSGHYLRREQYRPSLGLSGLALITQTVSLFTGLYPRIIVSSLDPRWSLDIYNSAASPLTLKIITSLMLVVLPVIIAVEMWKFYIFRQIVSLQEIELAPRLPRLRQMREQLQQYIKYACCLADTLDKTRKALRSNDGIIINKLKAKHRTLLFGKPHLHRRPVKQNRTKK
ncbi:cytochrome d ubiquinol oxidase subunit II [Sporomusa termitida]|uniref:Cytochrome bd-I ubiquinol oxidase subunit 2 n=1 Tax=Sporomusa termitida TaxID=2377 RepID=A0A517DWG9_9FIRM|nr:cytochrome d ubiquinol oxidase subunit II [Sporomusa termitida]QDR81705.1 Cytochrome bd-I ubiquinol oxidase subunit 2 [Sporomusa termitida]